MNISPSLSMCAVIGYSKSTPINNKPAKNNNIVQDTSAIFEYSDFIKDHVTVL